MRKKLIMAAWMLGMVLTLSACTQNGGSEPQSQAQTPEQKQTEQAPVTKEQTSEESSSEKVTSVGITEEENTSSPEETSEEIASSATEEKSEEDTSSAPEEKKNEEEKVLVAVFSVTGHTKNVAEMIVKIEDADLYEIVPAVPYTDEDIDYSNFNCRAIKEQNNASTRPEIGSDPVSLDEYTKIYVGYPIWAASEPRIMDTFVESYDFGDATVIPFCTSGSSGIGSTGTKLASLAGSGNWESGKRFPATATEADVQNWIDSMK